MGSAELDPIHDKLTVYSHIITYGNAADATITEQMRDEIETMWNEPKAIISFDQKEILIAFTITAEYRPGITQQEIIENTDPRNNYFRIEQFSSTSISFVDGLGCNSGYFQLDNLYIGSTTAAHEYGHTLGLDHPTDLDLRGKGVPGIMYPRGTLVDPPFQYNPNGKAGDKDNGGTMHPKYRKVHAEDIKQLKLHRLDYKDHKAIIGEFSSIWHPDHATVQNAD